MNSKINKVVTLIIQIFWPFGGFLFSFHKNFKDQRSLVYVFISGFYGYMYKPAPQSDMVRYLSEFTRLSKLSFSKIIFEINSGEYSDFYTVLLSYLVSNFTKNPQVYLAVASLIYAYFYIRCIELILEKFKLSDNVYTKILIFILYFYVPIFFINGLRFYTAFYVFLFSLIQIFFYQRKRFYLLMLLTPLIHISFLATTIIFLLFSFLGKNRILSYLLLTISLTSSLTSFDFSALSGDNKAEKKILSYTDVETGIDFFENLKFIHSNSNSNYLFFETITNLHFYFVLIFFIIILLSKQKILSQFDHYNNKLINLNIFFLSLVFFMQSIPEGYRFQHIFVFIFLVTLLTKFDKLIKNYIFKISFILSSIGLLLYVFLNIFLNIKIIPVEFYIENWIIN